MGQETECLGEKQGDFLRGFSPVQLGVGFPKQGAQPGETYPQSPAPPQHLCPFKCLQFSSLCVRADWSGLPVLWGHKPVEPAPQGLCASSILLRTGVLVRGWSLRGPQTRILDWILLHTGPQAQNPEGQLDTLFVLQIVRATWVTLMPLTLPASLPLTHLANFSSFLTNQVMSPSPPAGEVKGSLLCAHPLTPGTPTYVPL